MKNLASYPSVAAAFADLVDGDMFYIPGGDWVIPGNITLSVSSVTIEQCGRFVKDPSAGVTPMIILADGVKDIDWRNPRFKGNRRDFADGQPVSAILGHRNENIRFRGGRFENLCDSGIKLRQVWGLCVEDVEFDDISENGVETRWYENDPRTGQPWSWLPSSGGNVRATKNRFRRVGRFEDVAQGTGLVDGCAMTADNGQTTRTVTNVSFEENYVEDCLRGFFSENHSKAVQRLKVVRNDIVGTASAGVYTRAGVGIIGVDDFEVTGNKIRNIGNHNSAGADRQGIIISASGVASSNGRVERNDIVDDRSSATRMQYGINLNAGQNIDIRNNRIHNGSVQNLRINDALCSGITTGGNRGATDEHSWQDTFEVEYYIEQLAVGAGWAVLRPSGWNADANTATTGRYAIVGSSYRLTAPVVSGATLQIAPFVNGNQLATFLVNEGSFAGTQYASKKASLQSAPMVADLAGIAVRYSTSGNFGAGNGAYVKLVFDRTRKL